MSGWLGDDSRYRIHIRTAGSAGAAVRPAIVDFCNTLLQISAALGRGILSQLRYNSRNWPSS
jgi:hypothetical protein